MLGRQVGVVLRARLHHAQHANNDLAGRALQSLGLYIPAYQSLRGYATPGRPRTAVGEPSKPVKRAVKRAAAAPSASTAADSPARRRVDASKKAAATKKPVTKKAAAAPKKKVAKVLTDEETAKRKATAAKKADVAKVRELKEAALSPPQNKRLSAYLVFFGEKVRTALAGASGTEGQPITAQLGKIAKEVGAEWKTLTPAEIEHYNHLASTSTAANKAEYKRWVESHNPEQIRLANRARASLRRRGVSPKSKWSDIEDERAVRRPVNAYSQFVINRNASPDFNNISLGDRSGLIAKEWKALSESEKQKYTNLYIEDRKRFVNEYTDTYGSAPPLQRAAAASE